VEEDEDSMDPTAYFENRLKAVGAVKAAGGNPYPHKFDVSVQLPDYIKEYEPLEAGQQKEDVTVKLAGCLR
jgi:lysyl-tRNA synthetase class 2